MPTYEDKDRKLRWKRINRNLPEKKEVKKEEKKKKDKKKDKPEKK